MTRAAIVRVFATAVLSLGLAGCSTSPPRPEGYDAAARTAWLNLWSPRTASYRRLVDKTIRGELRRFVRDCRRSSLDTRRATLLYRLDASGRQVESMMYPVSDFAECVDAGMGEYPLPPPPKPDYWLGFFIQGCPLGGGNRTCPQLVP